MVIKFKKNDFWLTFKQIEKKGEKRKALRMEMNFIGNLNVTVNTKYVRDRSDIS